MNTLVAPAADCATRSVGDRFRGWLHIALRVVAFSLLFGLVMSVLEPTLFAVVENLVYSMCIGLCIFATMSLLGLGLKPQGGESSFAGYLIRGLVGIPIGLFAGLNLGALLCGNPVGLAVLNRAAFLAFPFTVIASAGIMYVLWSRKRMADAAALHASTERQMAEARLKLLQAQIEPHMLFNTLANLRTLVDVDPARAQTMIDQLIVYLRGTLSASRSASTTLADEFAQLDAYLALMKVRMASRLQVIFDLPPALAGATIPPMLLQPLVENAIKHGLEPRVEGGTVRITASSSDGRLRVDVCDDGIGLSGDASPDSYGLAHVRERLQTSYGDEGRLDVEALPGGGVRARVVLPR